MRDRSRLRLKPLELALREETPDARLHDNDLLDLRVVPLSRQVSAAIPLNLDGFVIPHRVRELLSCDETSSIALYRQDALLRAGVPRTLIPAFHESLDRCCGSISSQVVRFPARRKMRSVNYTIFIRLQWFLVVCEGLLSSRASLFSAVIAII